MSADPKTLNAVDESDAKAKVSDIEVVGNTDLLELICKASSKSQGWMKSMKAVFLPHGAIVQVTTQQGDNVAEALCFVPGATRETLPPAK